jgi:hypothetical protein
MRPNGRVLIVRWRPTAVGALLFVLLLLSSSAAAEVITVMTANLNSGTPPYNDWYRESSKRIFQGLKPDIVLIQEFNVPSTTDRGQFIH